MDIEKMELQKREIDQNVIKRPKLLKAAVIGLAVFVIVAATTLVAVYIGGKMTKDTYQEAWETVQDLEGRYMEERMNKSKDMTEIDVPNTVQIIYDYKNNLAVFRYTYSESKIRDRCYARAIDSEFDPKQLGYDTESEGQNPNEFISTTRKWKFTEREVPSFMTSSSRVQDMCGGTQIYWMEVMDDTQIEKRDAHTRELILILPVSLIGIPCNIFVYLERNSLGIPVGITFSTPDCTPLTTTTSATTTATSTTTASTPTTPTSSATTTVTSTTTASTTSMTTTTPTTSMSTTTTTIPTTTPC
ncbi:uncharacterized protein LOC127854452 [Dreissena polymorpha]|uniref:uncharacterized protein LOC127854452 n=1 Tax=Dreissena polymorpha TaxID=45954 RepID=UPI0022652B2B|nr:uncharacterized protein LOC127854452 [Dreissena polymorpha]